MKFFIAFFVLINFQFSFANCDKEQVNTQFSNTAEVLGRQASQLENIKTGNLTEYIDLQNIFGSDFNVDGQKDLLKTIKDNIRENKHLNKYSNLINCLKVLKKEKEIIQITTLVNDLEYLKIKFLEFNIKFNNALNEKVNSQNNLPDLKNELEVEKKQSDLLKKELESKVVVADKEALKENSVERKELAYFESMITKTKIDIVDYGLQFISILEEKIKKHEVISKKLDEIMNSFNKKDKGRDYLKEVNSIWSEVIEGNFNQIFSEDSDFKIPQLPNLISAPVEAKNKEYFERIKDFYIKLKEVRQKTISEVLDKKTQELKLQNSLLIQVNTVRSRLYQDYTYGKVLESMFTTSFWSLMIKELKASPYRIVSFVYEKNLYVNEHLLNGKSGHKIIIFDLFYVFLFCGIIFVIKKGISFIINQINKFVRVNANLFYKNNFARIFSTLWSKLKKDADIYIWLSILLIIQKLNFVSDYHLIIDFVVIFLWYKVINSLLVLFLGNISKIDYKNYGQFRAKAQATSLSISRIYLFYAISMLLVHGAVGKVYFYTAINFLCGLLLAYKVIQKSGEWNTELQKYLERHFSGLIVDKINKGLAFLPERLRGPFYLVFICLMQAFNLFIALTENFEISKKISANLFKKQIESLEVDTEERNNIPPDYKKLFNLDSFDSEFISPNDSLIEKLKNEINEWSTQISDEHSLVIYGDKGIGKTTLMKYLLADSKNYENTEGLYLKLSTKILSIKSLYQFLNESIGVNSAEELMAYDQQLNGKVIIGLDEAQNIFLSETGGFEAYYELINLVNLPTKNIFWIFSFNKYSWLYLDRAFGRNLFFRNIYEVKGWNDQKIKELIMARHSKSKFHLSYDLLISATKSDEEIDRYTSVEAKFFTLLWELSHGNPRAALFLWPTSLTRKRRDVFTVNIPKLSPLESLGSSSDNLLFVLTSALKHENVTVDEIVRSTHLPIGIIRNAIKVAMERNYLYRDLKGRYMIEISTQNSIIKHLKMKNFIYGS